MHNNNKLKIVTQVFASFSVQVLQNLFVALCTCWCYDQRRQSIPRVESGSLKVKYYTEQYMLPNTPTQMSQVAKLTITAAHQVFKFSALFNCLSFSI